MKNLCRVFMLLLFGSLSALPVQAQSVEQQIMDHLFNAELAQADSLIDMGIKQNPNHPKYYFLKAHYNFYMRYFAQRQFDRDSILQVIIDNGEKAVSFEDEVEVTIENQFYFGSAYGLLSRAYVMKGELWDGYWAALDCEDYLEEVLDEDPNYGDAYIGLGVIEYFTGRLTGYQSFLAWMGGVSGDTETGLEYFKKAAENGKLLKNEANFILATMYRFIEIDLDQARTYFALLNEKFPNNAFITNQYRQTVLAQVIAEKGFNYLKSNIDSLRVAYNINNSGVLNIMGYNFSGREEYETAIAIFKLNIELYPDEANPYDSISECYQLQGNNIKAIEYTKIGLQKLPTDSTINEQFRENLKNIMETRLKDLGAITEV
jgi:tetratricopeptide (TPR) repeat protein